MKKFTLLTLALLSLTLQSNNISALEQGHSQPVLLASCDGLKIFYGVNGDGNPYFREDLNFNLSFFSEEFHEGNRGKGIEGTRHFSTTTSSPHTNDNIRIRQISEIEFEILLMDKETKDDLETSLKYFDYGDIINDIASLDAYFSNGLHGIGMRLIIFYGKNKNILAKTIQIGFLVMACIN